ncbi:MAG: phosphoribosylamine--glycine ligase [Actinomycetota bacterium]|nr:phosphoribosylamine--glycine ligase [Actinomycetota bacterium]
MRVLLVGGGGREHALGWKLAQSHTITDLIAVPGNPGFAQLGACIPGVDILDTQAVVQLALANAIDLVVIGPEGPLAAGAVDALTAAGIRAFGPTRAGARLESSKAFAKEIMERAGVATARSRAFTDVDEAIDYLETVDGPYVVKADGLAYGKGVLVTEDLIAAQGWARLCIAGEFGDAGLTVVIEDYLAGQEVSVFAICDGTRALPLEPARDYKRHLDGGRGPNTGGMGCYSPVTDLPEDLVDHTINEVIQPVLATLAEDGIEYRGFLYAGLVLTADGPKVLEFNCRLGDPETQVLMSRLDEDLLEILASAAEGYLPDGPLQWYDRAAVDVVLTAAGYPDNAEVGRAISGVNEVNGIPNVQVFHANTRRTPDGLITAGGRVLNIVATGQSVPEARALAYEAASHIHFGGIHYRRDVAQS